MTKGKNSKGNQKAAKNKTSKSKNTPLPKEKFEPNLLGIALEIRNQIYRDLLSAYWPEVVEVGTPRCQNIWKQTLDYAPAILSTCRQIYAEASSVFPLENTLIMVRVNKAGYGKAIKERGFGVVYRGNVDHIKHPVLKVSVEFPSLKSRNGEDTFVISPVSLTQLPRALWTTKGLEEMILSLELHPIFASRPANEEDDLLFCFHQIRGLRKLNLKGVQQKKYIKGMPNALKAPYKHGKEILKDLEFGLLAPQHAVQHRNWALAADHIEATIAFLADCYKIYGEDFVCDNNQNHEKICKTAINLAAGLAQLRLRVGQYESVIKYATLAQRILPIADHSKVDLLLMRGEAYEALGQDVKLMKDLLEAQQLMPENKLVTVELTKLKKRLDPDPIKALAAFKDLRVSVSQEKHAEERALNTALNGKIVVKGLPN